MLSKLFNLNSGASIDTLYSCYTNTNHHILNDSPIPIYEYPTYPPRPLKICPLNSSARTRRTITRTTRIQRVSVVNVLGRYRESARLRESGVRRS